MGIFRRFRQQPQAPPPPPEQVGPITDWSFHALGGTAYVFEPAGRKIVNVVGEASYQGTLEQLAEGRTSDGGRVRDHKAVLVPEPTNPYDPNAVRVVLVAAIPGLVGYLSREDAVAYRPVIERLAAIGKLTACRASLTGGWDRGPEDRGSFGVKLYLAEPGALITELETTPDALKPAWL